MSRTKPFGTHHSHFQPREADGTFISYEQSGRRLGRHAVSRGQRVMATERTFRVAPAR